MDDLYRVVANAKCLTHGQEEMLPQFLCHHCGSILAWLEPVERCEHGMIDEHEADWERGPDGRAFKPWCKGAPDV